MRLSRSMIGVLAENDDLYLVERGEVKRIENQRARGIHGIMVFLIHQESLQLSEIGSLKLRLQHSIPRVVDVRSFDFHTNYFCKDENKSDKNPLFCKII